MIAAQPGGRQYDSTAGSGQPQSHGPHSGSVGSHMQAQSQPPPMSIDSHVQSVGQAAASAQAICGGMHQAATVVHSSGTGSAGGGQSHGGHSPSAGSHSGQAQPELPPPLQTSCAAHSKPPAQSASASHAAATKTQRSSAAGGVSMQPPHSQGGHSTPGSQPGQAQSHAIPPTSTSRQAKPYGQSASAAQIGPATAGGSCSYALHSLVVVQVSSHGVPSPGHGGHSPDVSQSSPSGQSALLAQGTAEAKPGNASTRPATNRYVRMIDPSCRQPSAARPTREPPARQGAASGRDRDLMGASATVPAMRRASLLLGLLPLWGCLLLSESPQEAPPGCESALDCDEGQLCSSGACVVSNEPSLGEVGDRCDADETCGSGRCWEATCCAPGCGGAACGERRCGERCSDGCVFSAVESLSPACGVDGWPIARESSPLAVRSDGSMLVFSGATAFTTGASVATAANDLHRLTILESATGFAADWAPLPLPADGSGPAPRYGHVLAGLPAPLCVALERTPPCTLLFGGRSPGGGGFAETWVHDDATGFQPLTPGTEGPSARLAAAYAVDDGWRGEGVAPAPARLVLVGGYACQPTGCSYAALADTWIFDVAGWHELPSEPAPPPRARASLAGPLLDGSFLLLGGSPGKDVLLADAALARPWRLEANGWRAATELGEPEWQRTAAAMHLAPSRDLLLLVGGFKAANGREWDSGLYRAEWLDLAATGTPWAAFASPAMPGALGFRGSGIVPDLGLVLLGGWGFETNGDKEPGASCQLHVLPLY